MCVYSFHKNKNRKIEGITLVELGVVIVLIAIFLAMLLPALSRSHSGPRISCGNNLMQIGTAYRIWENDNGDKYPMQQIMAQGGMAELLSGSANAGRYTWLNYSIMQNELGQTPKVVVCPQDERTANTNFWPMANYPGLSNSYNFGGTGTFDNSNVSYFVGAGASDLYPQSILGGDRNLCGGRTVDAVTEAINPSVGADVVINTNGFWVSAKASYGAELNYSGQVVQWSAKIHSVGRPEGLGNIF
jgi:competence protein ComGC